VEALRALRKVPEVAVVTVEAVLGARRKELRLLEEEGLLEGQ
jgi:hypothetical protein